MPYSRGMGTENRALLFSDIEGSTSLLERAGEQYWSLLSRHREIVREAICVHDGVEHGTEGDSFFVSFQSAAAGVRAALAIQRRLQAEQWPDQLAVRVRIGLHVGEVVDHGGNLVGVAVHHAARVAGAANGGQVVATEEVRHSATGLGDDVEFLSRGHFRLRDMGAVELLQVQEPDVPAPRTALRANPAPRTNLPPRADSLVGRTDELQQVEEFLRTRSLVSLVGAGGVGKTSLAVEAASAVIDEFDGGVWMVELGAVTDGGDVLAAAVDALSVAAQPGVDVFDSIVDRVGARRTLLLLDNCEHVLDACRQFVGQLVAACSTVIVLATSREPLGVRSEQVVRLGPLDDDDDLVRLFTERATQADHSFTVSVAERSTIVEIGRRLDGVPLAIELAAARVRSLSVADIAARLADRFRLLRDGTGGHEDRHRTLRATVDWSYRMLGDDGRKVFERLSVFNGAIDLNAVEAVCDDGDLADDVLDVLQSLVDRSMVVTDRRTEATRYRLLETMREYAAERLAAADDVTRRRHRHLEHFLEFAERHERLLVSATPETSDRWFADNWDELRGAFRWSLEAGRFETADRLVVATAWSSFWHLRAEHLEWSELLWALDGSAGHLSVQGCGVLAYWRGTMITDEQGSWLLAREGLSRATDPTHIGTLLCWTCLPFADSAEDGQTFGPRYRGLSAVLAAMADPAHDWRVLTELDDAAHASGNREAVDRSISAMRDAVTRVAAPELQFHAEMSAGHRAMRVVPPESAAARVSYNVALDNARAVRNPRLVGMALRALAFVAVRSGESDSLSRCVEAVEALHDSRYWQKLFQALEATALALARAGRVSDAASIISMLEREVPEPLGLETEFGFRGMTRGLIESHAGEWQAVPSLGRDAIVAMVVASASSPTI